MISERRLRRLEARATRLNDNVTSYRLESDAKELLHDKDSLRSASFSFEDAGAIALNLRKPIRAILLFLKAGQAIQDSAEYLEHTNAIRLAAEDFERAGKVYGKVGLGAKRRSRKMYSRAAEHFIDLANDRSLMAPTEDSRDPYSLLEERKFLSRRASFSAHKSGNKKLMKRVEDLNWELMQLRHDIPIRS